jgi:hypothetical protein
MVLLPLLKAHVRVPHDAEDTLLEAYERAAVAYLERRSGLYLGTPKTATAANTGSRIFLVGPVVSIDSVTDANAEAVDYTVDGSIVTLARSPRNVIHTVTYTHGYTPGTEPANYHQAVLMLVAHWYSNRTPMAATTVSSEIPHAVDALVPLAPVVA